MGSLGAHAMTGAIDLFADFQLRTRFETAKALLVSRISSETGDYILNVSPTKYKQYLLSRYALDVPTLSTDEVQAEDSKILNSGGKAIDSVRYCIPFEGDEVLFRCRPSESLGGGKRGVLDSGWLCFEIANYNNDANEIRREYENTTAWIERQLGNLAREAVRYNRSLEELAAREFRTRKQNILDKANMLAELGVPIRRRDNLPETFAIPSPEKRKRVTITRPTVAEAGFKPEPTLDQAVYEDILRVIHELGKAFERMSYVYEGKDEEQIRDVLLVFLEAWFEGSATGETFNKTGKTDILLRHEGKNAFVAECRIWRGPKDYIDNIDQLLRYLTWRDSKTAVVLFVRNKGFTEVIERVEAATPKHPCFVGFAGKREESWLDYRLHLIGDPNREVRMATLLFHFPPAA